MVYLVWLILFLLLFLVLGLGIYFLPVILIGILIFWIYNMLVRKPREKKARQEEIPYYIVIRRENNLDPGKPREPIEGSIDVEYTETDLEESEQER